MNLIRLNEHKKNIHTLKTVDFIIHNALTVGFLISITAWFISLI